jgi:simple sugar transport system ATP-binding protein
VIASASKGAADDRRPLYAVEGVTKHFGNVVALEDVNFSVAAGEVVGLVGDNGAGKSTLVGVLSGAYEPDSGSIFLNGEEIRWSSPRDALAAGIETLYQESGIAPDLTVAANIFLGREILKKGLLGRLGFLSEGDMYERARKELERVGIAMPGANRTVSQLSGGQRQAVAIGRAIAWAKKVILLDEPTNHLGARQAADVLDVIRQAGRNGLAVVFISHTLPHVLDVTNRIVVLRLGQVVADRPTSQFTHESLLKAIAGLK